MKKIILLALISTFSFAQKVTLKAGGSITLDFQPAVKVNSLDKKEIVFDRNGAYEKECSIEFTDKAFEELEDHNIMITKFSNLTLDSAKYVKHGKYRFVNLNLNNRYIKRISIDLFEGELLSNDEYELLISPTALKACGVSFKEPFYQDIVDILGR